MILAAGRGTRMGTLTDTTPKPLLPLAGMPLIEYHVRALASAGFRELVINVAWLGDQLVDALGDGSRYGVDIAWSREPQGALETAGGIAHALPLLGDEPFAVVNADVWSDFPFHTLRDALRDEPASDDLAHLVMVPNPDHNPHGDFRVVPSSKGDDTQRERLISDETELAGDIRADRLTYSGLGAYRPEAFTDIVGRAALGPLLRNAVGEGRISAQRFTGHWWDVGTPARLAGVERFLCGVGSTQGQ